MEKLPTTCMYKYRWILKEYNKMKKKVSMKIRRIDWKGALNCYLHDLSKQRAMILLSCGYERAFGNHLRIFKINSIE